MLRCGYKAIAIGAGPSWINLPNVFAILRIVGVCSRAKKEHEKRYKREERQWNLIGPAKSHDIGSRNAPLRRAA